jgi:hypothetical protein
VDRAQELLRYLHVEAAADDGGQLGLDVDLVEGDLAAGALVLHHLVHHRPGLVAGIHGDADGELLEFGPEGHRLALRRDGEVAAQLVLRGDDAARDLLGHLRVAAHRVGGQALAVPAEADLGAAVAFGERDREGEAETAVREAEPRLAGLQHALDLDDVHVVS